MTTEEKVKNLVNEFNENHRNKTFAEFIAELFAGKYIEIYLGDSYEEVSVEQISTNYPAVFCGKVVTAFKECLIINSVYADKRSKKIKLGNLMFINERSIRALNEIDDKGVMSDMFLLSQESLLIKKEFIDKK
jgi:hypothetical protein